MTQAREPKRILVAEPDPSISEALREFLVHIGYEAVVADNHEDIIAQATKGGFGVVIMDYLLNASGNGNILDEISEIDPTICSIVLMSFPLVEYVLAAFRKGVFDVVVKPVDLFELDEIVARAFRRYEQNKAYKYVSDNLEKIDELARNGELSPCGKLPEPVA